SFQGLLYGTLCLAPILVTVPLDDGISELRTIQDLNVDLWVSQKPRNAFTSQRGHLMKTFNTIPGLNSVPLDYGYSLFAENILSYPPYNILANKMAPAKDDEIPYEGNILAIKHAPFKPSEVKNMNDKDIYLLDTILRR
ncbi:hypothetical protein BV22DRAFT_1187225, partial [Leucogyrophana mollusca]